MQKILVVAPRGKMGRLIIETVLEREDMILSGSLAPKGRSYIGEDSGKAAGLSIIADAPVYDDLDIAIKNCDVIIDFSMIEVSKEILKKAVEYKKPLVCGTTGFTKEEIKEFETACKTIPLLYAANTSKAVNCMNKLLAITSNIIGKDSDIEIIEMHDKNKLDAPSGTAKEMGQIIAENLNLQFEDVAKFGRSGKGKRSDNEIGYHCVRAGDISSSHSVIFGMMGERLEITHHTYNWTCFARGACDCAKFLQNKKPGMYNVKDVLMM